MRSSGSEEEPRGRSHSEHLVGAREGEDRYGHDDRWADGNDAGGGRTRRSRKSPRRAEKKKGSFWRELPVLIVTALVLTVLIQAFLARVYVIPSESMEETLHGCTGCDNDRVLVDKVSYRFTDPNPGDVVVFRGPESWDNHEFKQTGSSNPVAGFFQGAASLLGFGSPDEKDFVKRVIATEGQTVACCDTQNRVTVDGKPLNEPYIHWRPGYPHAQQPFGPVTVPAGHLWMMGDNRNNSSDSRIQSGGGAKAAVPTDNVLGKAQFIVLPPSRWQGVDDPNPQAKAMGAPAWQSGAPAGVGLAAAFPAVWAGRKLVRGTRGRGSQE